MVAYPLPITGVVASQDSANTSDYWCTYYNPNGTLAANKAYLEYNGGNNARRFFSFGFEETTSIDQVSSSKIQVSGSDVYDLQGRQVKQPTRGLYIKNGKKVVIK